MNEDLVKKAAQQGTRRITIFENLFLLKLRDNNQETVKRNFIFNL
jgi:hypothetical protein